jgi:hypothetical protein
MERKVQDSLTCERGAADEKEKDALAGPYDQLDWETERE